MNEEKNIPEDEVKNQLSQTINGDEHFPEDPGLDPGLAPVPITRNPVRSGDQQGGQQPETNDMELHHHSHSHGKRNWKSYFWEFLMLFLAVTIGFFVENQREHYIEHKREKQFAKQLLNDLRKDSVFYDSRQNTFDRVFSKEKMISQLLTQARVSDKNLLEGFIQVFLSFDVNLTNTTFNQMKTSGSLRYIRNTELTAELQKYYDVMSQRVIDEGVVSKNFLKDYLLPFYLKHVRTQDVDPMQGAITSTTPVMLGRSVDTDQELVNITDMYRVVNLSISEHTNKPAAKQAYTLIEMIKKEYHLE